MRQFASPSLHIVGVLSKSFIALGFINFLVGAILGGWMASDPTGWARIGSVHGEINPFGWLTMLIYGMTYAVLSISAGIKPPKAWVGWFQLYMAELAIIVVSTAYLMRNSGLLRIGLFLQLLAPVTFLTNILLAVLHSRKNGRATHRVERGDEHVVHSPIDTHPNPLSLLEKGQLFKATDRIGQRGTDVSLMVLIAATMWMFFDSLAPNGTDGLPTISTGASLLVDYGWIAGTIFAVGLHLFPRFVGANRIRAGSMSIGQALWIFSLSATLFLQILLPGSVTWGFRLMGVAFAFIALVFLKGLLIRNRYTVMTIPTPSIVAWYGGWFVALALGIALILGLNPMSLAALHMLFLGFATTVVYGVGYTLFPLMLRKRGLSPTLAMLQVWAGLIGFLMMWMGLMTMVLPIHVPGAFSILGIGGSLAAVSAIVFLGQWPLSRG